MKTGLESLLENPELRQRLKGRRVALLAHPASVTRELTHALDALGGLPEIRLSAAFGPQHGLRGDKQDNMMESPDFIDSYWGIPIFSLYGEVRRPTPAMMASFDVLLVDLQDLGCRIYTFITTLRYVLEEAARHGKAVWVLDRPNPAGRPIEGLSLRPGWESFVGAGPMPMRHGLTMAELAHWFIATLKLNVDCEVVRMNGWQADTLPGHGWPAERSWINPSPNAPNVSMARCYAGTVMLEGTTLSEGRGTTRPLELFGAPDIDGAALIARMQKLAPEWLAGCRLRPCWFEPTFHKHAGTLCSGVQIHVEDPTHYVHGSFKPWRLMALAFKAIRQMQPDYPLWRDFPYEYENERLAIDLINGSPLLREWVDDPTASPGDLDSLSVVDETLWRTECADFFTCTDMCLGIPLQVMEVDTASGGAFAWCEGELSGKWRRERLNILWLGDVEPGEWVYAVLGQARERLSPERAEEIRRALEGVQAALSGESCLDAYFPDLIHPESEHRG